MVGISVILWGLVAAADSQRPPREAAIALAKAALTEQVGAGTEAPALVSAADAVWRDSSLGCPAPGAVYSPVMTSGYRVTLSVRGRRYVVHVGQGRAVVCQATDPARGGRAQPPSPERDVAPAKQPTTSAVAGLKLAEQARDDLAKKLSVEKGQVTISVFRAAMWPDAGLGCPAPGQVYTQQLTKGFTIELASGGKTYEYHSDMQQVVPCDPRP